MRHDATPTNPWRSSFFMVDETLIPIRMSSERAAQESERRLERHIVYLERATALLAGVVDAAIQATDMTELYREACRVAVEQGGLRFAWVGQINRAGEIVPVAHAGVDEGYLVAAAITAKTTPRGSGPTGRAIREGRPIVTADIRTDPTMAPWREAALARGYRSAGAFPVRRAGTIVGTINFYSAETEFFTPSAVRLLTSIANVLSFAEDVLATRAAMAARR